MSIKNPQLLLAFALILLVFSSAAAQTPNLPSETPQKFEPTNDGFDTSGAK
jgi:hypothetical protein